MERKTISYASNYEITDDGRVWRKHTGGRLGMWLSTSLNGHGYLKVALTVGGKQIWKYIHTLVLDAFSHMKKSIKSDSFLNSTIL